MNCGGVSVIFGPAYKGIPLVAATASAIWQQHGVNVPWGFNRKEAKDHGEGGTIIGAKLSGRVVIIDDVISAGTSVRESVEMIRAQNATPCAVLIALDRMEKSGAEGALSNLSAVQEVEQNFGMPVLPIANLNDLFAYLSGPGASAELTTFRTAVATYRERYGVA
jgi:orotate phosphoribosyltransferase